MCLNSFFYIKEIYFIQELPKHYELKSYFILRNSKVFDFFIVIVNKFLQLYKHLTTALI